MHTGGAFHTDADASDYGGQGVHTAARIGAAAAKSEILVSRETLDGIGTAFRLSEPRAEELKGFDEPVDVVDGPLALIPSASGLRRASRPGCSCSTTGAAPTRTTCSRSPTRSTASAGSMSSRPRAPLELPGWPGYHWYVVPRVGYPDPETFHRAFDALAAFHDDVWERTGVTPARTVFGGFSMGSVMSYSLGLA